MDPQYQCKLRSLFDGWRERRRRLFVQLYGSSAVACIRRTKAIKVPDEGHADSAPGANSGCVGTAVLYDSRPEPDAVDVLPTHHRGVGRVRLSRPHRYGCRRSERRPCLNPLRLSLSRTKQELERIHEKSMAFDLCHDNWRLAVGYHQRPVAARRVARGSSYDGTWSVAVYTFWSRFALERLGERDLADMGLTQYGPGLPVFTALRAEAGPRRFSCQNAKVDTGATHGLWQSRRVLSAMAHWSQRVPRYSSFDESAKVLSYWMSIADAVLPTVTCTVCPGRMCYLVCVRSLMEISLMEFTGSKKR